MKKVIALTILILILLPSIALAGDVAYDIAFGDQDAFVIGKVTNMKDNLYSVHIEKVLMGDIEATDIQVEKPKYPSGWDNPTVGQHYALSLDKKNTVYEIKFGGYKADSTDYKTLKLEYADIPGNAVLEVQEFINSGRFIEADKVAKAKKNKEVSSQAISETNINQENAVQVSNTNSESPFSSTNTVWATVAVIICGSLVFKLYKFSKN
ncbi:hypothetical protein SAMN05443529_11222 [Desulfosporosinus hippei DSM 8344]|uniref:Uncharacterized protein n=1 Tax=Desulfosporosinus hippei DSM 8344 TaxID=1121419 RepID=A0A1G8BH21_9FIRM|nr:hypothetical protein SAMN05443529_11222 [Desulfosporosinus hippei DSM 8344]